MPQSKWYRVTFFFPVIMPLIVLTAFFFFYKGFLLCDGSGPACSPLSSALLSAGIDNGDNTHVANYAARAYWTVLNGLNVLASIGAIVIAGLVMYQALSDYKPRERWILIVAAILLAADLSLFVAIGFLYDVNSPAQELFRATIGPGFPHINKFNRLMELFALTATLTLAFAACAILWRRELQTVETEVELARRMYWLRTVLYVGGTLLAISVLRLSGSLGWAASYLPVDTSTGKLVETLVKAIVSSTGTLYTLLMAAVYLPAILLLRERATVLTPGTTPQESAVWLEKNGLMLPVFKLIPQLLALVGPMIAGPIADLFVKSASLFSG